MFSYEAPSTWVENPHPSGSRILEFRAGPALVTFSILSGVAGGPGANVNRWRGQVGLDPLSEEAAQASLKPSVFLGKEAWSADVAGPERSIRCLFTLSEPFSMFLKMDGPAAAVAAQKETFEAFAASMKVNH